MSSLPSSAPSGRKIPDKYPVRRIKRTRPLFSVKKSLYGTYSDLDNPEKPSTSETSETRNFSVFGSVVPPRLPILQNPRMRSRGSGLARHVRHVPKDANVPSTSTEGLLDTQKRLKASLKGTVFSGVDNRYKTLLSKKGPVPLKKAVKPVKAEKSSKSVAVLPKAEIEKQLNSLIGRKCETYLEKFTVLDERDKIMYKGRSKPNDMETADILQGICEDMCDEKERYRRIVQKRINRYECDENGEMIANLFVKEYSRSAADQEEPLPHELRPIAALERTMNYLLVKIAKSVPSSDENLAEWYDYLWSRTRAVRKDITQQMVSNELAADLIERCVRFHIFTAHRLCYLDINNFDQKMNTENLSKSLQSLRHLYDDLAKKGIYCKNEAELRVYDVMLNLKDSNILRQVLTYREEIRESEHMRLAFRLYYSLQSGNYVKFFNLLKIKATYLQFPMKKLVELLGFDNIEEAKEFVTKFGLTFDIDPDFEEEYIVLSKAKYLTPEFEVPLRVQDWIEAKRKDVELDSILSGGKKLEVVLFDGINSFNNDGIYACDPVIESFLYAVREQEQEEVNEDNRVCGLKRMKDGNDEGLENLVMTAVREIDYSIRREIVDQFFSKAAARFRVETAISSIANSIVEQSLRDTVANFLVMCDAEKKRKMCHEMLLSTIYALCEDVMGTIFEHMLNSIAKKTLKENKVNRRQKNKLRKLPAKIFDNLIDEIIDSSVEKAFVSLKAREEQEVAERLKGINERLDKLWLKQFTDRWKQAVESKKLKREKLIAIIKSQRSVFSCKSPTRVTRYFDSSELDFSAALKRVMDAHALRERRMRMVRKMFIKWRDYSRFQKEKREYLKEVVRKSRLGWRRKHPEAEDMHESKRRRMDDNKLDNLRLVLAEYEANRRSLVGTFIKNDYMNVPDEDIDSVTSAPIAPPFEESSLIDREQLALGVKYATETMERYGIGIFGCKSIYDRRPSHTNQRKSLVKQSQSIQDIPSQVDVSHLSEMNKRRLSDLSLRISNFVKEVDEACRKADENMARYEKLL